MIVLIGTLRQSGEVTIKDKPMLKVWVEHESPRDNGVNDLKIEEFFLPREQAAELPAKGEQVQVVVRPYPSGRGIAFAASRILRADPAPALAA